MIAVDRERPDATGAVIRPRGNWDARASDATALALEEAGEHDAKAAVYAADAVREALEELFWGKCAYCEVDVTGATWDVEHFRPKGRVQERPDHTGYYWLTYRWENLYPACQFCNQHRRDKPTWGEPATGPAAGKVDQFPLADESTRAMEPGDDLTAEARLLIDPCEDEPENYLAYQPNGRAYGIDDVAKGATSIDVYALNRKRLVERRRKVWGETVKLLETISLVEDVGVSAAPVRDLLEGRMERGEHAGVARFVARNRGVFLE